MVGLKDDNPTTYKENANLKGKIDNSYVEFRGKGNFAKKGNFI
jgi:hypothetical protein